MRIVACTDELVRSALYMCKEEYDLSPNAKTLPFSERVTLGTIRQCRHNPAYFGRLAIDDNNDCIGIIAGYVSTAFWSEELLSNLILWYVRRGVKNGGLAAKLLMQEFIQWSKEQEAAAIHTDVIANIDNYAADVMHRRLGFTHVGAAYAMALKG